VIAQELLCATVRMFVLYTCTTPDPRDMLGVARVSVGPCKQNDDLHRASSLHCWWARAAEGFAACFALHRWECQRMFDPNSACAVDNFLGAGVDCCAAPHPSHRQDYASVNISTDIHTNLLFLKLQHSSLQHSSGRSPGPNGRSSFQSQSPVSS